MVAKPLTGRVGKHRDGRQAQNNKADQESVITLLNMIPVADGGAGGTLPTRAVNGLASRALLKAIDTYQKKQFPGQVTGIIEPGGSQYMQMAVLAGRPPAATGAAVAAPARAPLRAGLTSQIVSTRVTEGLVGDNLLSHAEVVNIIRSTVHDGILTQDEINDLTWVAAHEKMAEPRSKELLETFVTAVATKFGTGPFELRGKKRQDAAELAFAFLERTGPNAFSKLNRNTVGVEMLLRIARPGLLKQDESSLCGPTSMLFNLLTDHPDRYAQFAVSLYEGGAGYLGSLAIVPSAGVKNYTPPNTMALVDWMTMASIRDSENFMLRYDDVGAQIAGITLPSELAGWFKKAGYSDIHEGTSFIPGRAASRVGDMNQLYSAGYRICMLINAQMTDGRSVVHGATSVAQGYYDLLTGSITDIVDNEVKLAGAIADAADGAPPNHWVVLRSRVTLVNDKVDLTIFTWGNGEFHIPPISTSDFAFSYFGYVAAKP